MKRRDFLTTTSSTAIAAQIASSSSDASEPTAAAGDAIRQENARPGTRNWQLNRVMLDKPLAVRASAIEGYCSRQSVLAGESIDILVSTATSVKFTIEIFRTGYYGGRGARLMKTLGPFQGKKQPDPTMGDKRLMECTWEPTTTLAIPADWPSGVYLGRLTTIPPAADKPYWQNYVVFIVRDTRKADILLQCSDNTWQAYNKWPESTSLYTDPRGAHARKVKASFDRPYGKYSQIYENPQSLGSGEWLCFEFPLAYWLEEQGYDVTYCSNSDCLDASQIRRAKVFLSAGHDEYWDVRQYQAMKSAIEAGVNVLWLTGNAVFAVTEFTSSTDGRPNRILERIGHFSGLSDAEVEASRKLFANEHLSAGPDESLIMGARTVVPFNGGGDWTCIAPDHWIFEGTGMKAGDSIPGLVGWEHHGAPAPIQGLQVVAAGLVWAGGTTPSGYAATIFPGPKGNFVFNASTIFWAQGLSSPPGHMIPWSHWSRPSGPDERVQRITQNLLRRGLSGRTS